MSISCVIRCDFCKQIIAEEALFEEAVNKAKEKSFVNFTNASGVESHICSNDMLRLIPNNKQT